MKPRSSSFSALYFTFLIALLPLTLQASGTSDFGDNAPAQQEEGAVDTQEKISAYIEHHIKDAHDFHLFSYNDSEGHRKHVGFPLPVIVYTSQGVRAFMSSEFHHDDSGHHDKLTLGEIDGARGLPEQREARQVSHFTKVTIKGLSPLRDRRACLYRLFIHL